MAQESLRDHTQQLCQPASHENLFGAHRMEIRQRAAQVGRVAIRIAAAVRECGLHGFDRKWRGTERVLVRIQFDQRSQNVGGVSPVRPLAVAQLFNRRFQARNFLEGQMPEFSRLNVQL
jgi:hypothetical protein